MIMMMPLKTGNISPSKEIASKAKHEQRRNNLRRKRAND
jgi:hypothetical protein